MVVSGRSSTVLIRSAFTMNGISFSRVSLINGLHLLRTLCHWRIIYRCNTGFVPLAACPPVSKRVAWLRHGENEPAGKFRLPGPFLVGLGLSVIQAASPA
jgi:hypothetical protein